MRDMPAGAADIIKQLRGLGDPADAEHLQRFFKTGKGKYGEGDRFLGIRVPAIRQCVKTYRAVSRETVEKLLQSEWHEVRLLALLILVAQYERAAGPSERQSIYRLYLRHTDRINNWDLVDLSAPNIVGAYLFDHDRKPLYRLARSSDLWERRIAMLATFYFIRKDDFKDALGIANILVDDAHDLIHKAVGWMLREVGKRDKAVEEKFLRKHCRTMPRTMLRYAIEKFPEDERQAYLKGEP
jgi:3-methyladenine DNA glycosylase AlkD